MSFKHIYYLYLHCDVTNHTANIIIYFDYTITYLKYFNDIFTYFMETFDLKRFRTDKNLTQIEITQLLGCAQSFISAVENGRRSLPSNMIEILQSKYGDISAYITNITEDTIIKESTPDQFLIAGADAFTKQIVQMMNDRLIAPYGMITEKDQEIQRLNRKIGHLEAELEIAKRGNVRGRENATCADVG